MLRDNARRWENVNSFRMTVTKEMEFEFNFKICLKTGSIQVRKNRN